MSATLLRPYELPPFELVKLIQPAFPPRASPTASPEVLSSSSFTSPVPVAGPSSPGPGTAAGHVHSASLNEKLSQLTAKVSTSLSPPSTSQSRFTTSSPAGATGVISPDLEGLQLGPAQPITTGKEAVLSHKDHQPALSKAPQVIRSVQAGTESIWIAGNEGSVAVWKLDITRASSKGKHRAQDDPKVAGTAEEASLTIFRTINRLRLTFPCGYRLHISLISTTLCQAGDRWKS